MNRLKIVIIGGGSNAWVPNIVKDMLLTEGINDAEFVLYDINKKASDLCKAFLDKLALQLNVKPKIVSTNNRKEAFRNGDYFVIVVSTGGLDAMSHDLAIPEEYGIYHTVGDTSGPGGWSRSIRNFDIFVDIANAINQYAPGAMVLNYTNPMTTLTDVLSRLCTGPVVGLCHGLFENLQFIKEVYKLDSEDQIAVNYAGVNHFIWITEARVGTTDVIADLNKRLRSRRLNSLLPVIHKDPLGLSSDRDVAEELLRQTGVMSPVADRHTCEFYSWYITNKQNIKKYHLERTSIKQRRKWFADRDRNLKKMVKTSIPEQYFKRSRETAADIISAHWLGKVFIDVGNTPNQGQIANLPLGSIVETAVRIDHNGITPITFGALPEVVAGMVEPWTRVFSMTVDACFAKDKAMALQALRLDPLCSHLNTQQTNELGMRLLAAHKRFVKCF